MYPYKIFGLFTLYGLMIGVGIVLCFLVLYVYGKRAKISSKFLDFSFYNGIVSIAVGFFFAYLVQAILDYLKNPQNGFHFQNITVMGGLVGGAACFILIYFIFRKNFEKGDMLKLLKVAPCCILIAHAFGRIGCFFAGCCYGIETTSWLGIEFTNRPGYIVYPTQLFEAIFLFLLFGLCSLLLYKRDYVYMLPLYLVCYGVFRFFIEFIRGDERGIVLGIQPSQYYSIIFVLGGVALFFWFKKLYKKLPSDYVKKKAIAIDKKLIKAEKKLELQELKQQKLEQEKLEQEKLEQQKLEQQKLEQEKLEQEKLEQQKLEQEKLEQEKIKLQQLQEQSQETKTLQGHPQEQTQKTKEKKKNKQNE